VCGSVLLCDHGRVAHAGVNGVRGGDMQGHGDGRGVLSIASGLRLFARSVHEWSAATTVARLFRHLVAARERKAKVAPHCQAESTRGRVQAGAEQSSTAKRQTHSADSVGASKEFRATSAAHV